MLTEIDPKLARSTASVLNVLIEVEPEHRARVLDAVTKLVALVAPTSLLLAAPRPEKRRCSSCGKLGHNKLGCPNRRRCSRCSSTGHDRRNCPDLETTA